MEDWADWGRDGSSYLGAKSISDLGLAFFVWTKSDEGTASETIDGEGFRAREDDDRKEVDRSFKHLKERALPAREVVLGDIEDDDEFAFFAFLVAVGE